MNTQSLESDATHAAPEESPKKDLFDMSKVMGWGCGVCCALVCPAPCSRTVIFSIWSL